MGWNANHISVGTRWGRAPTICEGIAGRVSFAAAGKGAKVYALDGGGTRAGEAPVSLAGGKVCFEIGPRFKTLWSRSSWNKGKGAKGKRPKPGLPAPDDPRTGAHRRTVETGRDQSTARWLGRRTARFHLAQLGKLAGRLDYAALSQALARFARRHEADPRLREEIAAIQDRLSE
jgi:hypothetical protein